MIGTIYCIREIATDKVIYVGSTISNLKKRISAHKTDCFIYKKPFPIYDYIRSVITAKEMFDKYFVFEILYMDVFNTKEDLFKTEEFYIKQYTDLLNKVKAFSTKQEKVEYMYDYRIDNREKNNAYHREYRKTEKQREYHRKYMREYYHKRKITEL